VKTAVEPKSGGGGAVSRLMALTDSGLTLYATKEGVEQQATQKLEARFKTIGGMPIYTNQQLYDNVGLLALTLLIMC